MSDLLVGHLKEPVYGFIERRLAVPGQSRYRNLDTLPEFSVPLGPLFEGADQALGTEGGRSEVLHQDLKTILEPVVDSIPVFCPYKDATNESFAFLQRFGRDWATLAKIRMGQTRSHVITSQRAGKLKAVVSNRLGSCKPQGVRVGLSLHPRSCVNAQAATYASAQQCREQGDRPVRPVHAHQLIHRKKAMNPTSKPGSKPTSWRPLTPAYAARKAALESKK